MANETNTCRKYVEPKLSSAGWQTEPHDYTEQYYFTAGRIQPRSRRRQRGERKFADYLLLYNGNFPIAVVEAKAKYKTADEGLEQAILILRGYANDYARILDVKLIVIDECHRGSAKDEGSWRQILQHFEPAYQLGLTATPLRDDNVDTYRYFGNPHY